MLLQIFLSIVCFMLAVSTMIAIVGNNRDIYGSTPIGWWIIGLGISQIFVVGILAILWMDWLMEHTTILKISVTMAIISFVLWVFAKLYTKRF